MPAGVVSQEDSSGSPRAASAYMSTMDTSISHAPGEDGAHTGMKSAARHCVVSVQGVAMPSHRVCTLVHGRLQGHRWHMQHGSGQVMCRALAVTHPSAVGVAPHLDPAVHVVAVQRIEAQAAARGCQLADLAHQVVHGVLSASQQADHTGGMACAGCWVPAHCSTRSCWGLPAA